MDLGGHARAGGCRGGWGESCGLSETMHSCWLEMPACVEPSLGSKMNVSMACSWVLRQTWGAHWQLEASCPKHHYTRCQHNVTSTRAYLCWG